MGTSAGKYFRFRNENTPDGKLKAKKQRSLENVRNSTEIKYDILQQIKTGCIGRSAHIGKGGVAFYTPLKEDHVEINIGDTPISSKSNHGNTPMKHHSDDLHDSFTAKEREIMAEVLKADSLREKGRGARVSEERRLLALRRRERKEEELKHRHVAKMREAEERRQAVQERLRPKHSKVIQFYNH